MENQKAKKYKKADRDSSNVHDQVKALAKVLTCLMESKSGKETSIVQKKAVNATPFPPMEEMFLYWLFTSSFVLTCNVLFRLSGLCVQQKAICESLCCL